MSENKLDRTSLKRQAQRVESYSVLVSKTRRTNFKNFTMNVGKSRTENRIERSQKLEHFNIDIKEYEGENKKKYYSEQCPSSPTSDNPSSSSDSSQGFHQSLYRNWRSAQNNSNQYEEDTSPVMTRSATRKYASVGAVLNRVDLKRELSIKRKWPVSVSSPPPNLPADSLQLKSVVSRSLNYVMSFCKYATTLNTEPPQKNVNFTLEKSDKLIDLIPYLSQEQLTENQDHQTQITLHLDESLLTQQFINVISINNEEQSRALVVHEDDDEMETITLHSGDTYIPLLDNKYTSNSDSVFVNLRKPRASSKIIQIIASEDPMMAVYNDHNYAMRFISVSEFQQSKLQTSPNEEMSELVFQNALKDLLLNTSMLKCLISGETPQEMIEFLNRAHHNRE